MRFLTYITTTAVFLSAYLLFMVQPMAAKILLPNVGGAPAIWNTTMLFFQMLLLGGYLYAHLLTKISSLRIQYTTHLLLMMAAACLLPIATHLPPPAPEDNPIWWQLRTMTGMMALPFLILSATAPLLQRWFSFTSHPLAKDPYFLYAASNIGSILALVLYPSAVEFLAPIDSQSSLWRYGFFLLTLLIGVSCLSALRHPTIITTTSTEDADEDSPNIKLRTIGLWLLLAFVPSSLMLGFTSFVTSNIGAIPLFWVIPLILYILSFILAFAKKQIIPLGLTRIMFAALFPVAFCIFNSIPDLNWDIAPVNGLLLFITCLMCHQELVRLKPDVKHLTLFFLIMSCGGALGGIFNTLIAPHIFVQPHEYMVVSILALFLWNIQKPMRFHLRDYPVSAYITCLVILAIAGFAFVVNSNPDATNRSHAVLLALGIAACGLILTLMGRRPLFITVCYIFALANPTIRYMINHHIVDISRNYFGTLTVIDKADTRELMHGNTLHGVQAIDPNLKKIPLSYYNQATANGEVFGLVTQKHPHGKIAGLGLGAGSIACLTTSQNAIDFYEIDPAVVTMVQDKAYFTYLADCGTPYKIIMGDARINVQQAPDNAYDMTFVDVFSGDNIPMHLTTEQAVDIYKHKTKPDGILLLHVSNRFFNLRKELGYIARDLNMHALSRLTAGGTTRVGNLPYSPVYSVALTNNAEYIAALKKMGWRDIDVSNDNSKAWTDDFATPLRAIIVGRYNHPYLTDSKPEPTSSR